MTKGFGLTTNEYKAIDLTVVADARGYFVDVYGNTVTLTNDNGISITVEVINDKYVVKRIDRDISYKHIHATMNGIATAFNMLLNESNKQYE